MLCGISNGCGASSWENAGLWQRFGKAQRDGEAGRVSDLLAISAMRRTGAEIQITTDEGDTVTLSMHSELDASFAYYRRPESRDQSGLRAAALSLSRSSDTEITVEGDLNEQERADVQKLVRQLSQVIRDFLSGNFDASVVRSFDDVASNSLSGYTLNVERVQSLTVTRGREVVREPVSTQPSIEPVSFTPVPAAPVAEPSVQRDVDGPRRWRSDGVDRVLRQLLRAVRESGLDLDRVARHLEKAMRRFLHRVGQEPTIEPARPPLEEIAAGFSAGMGVTPEPELELPTR